MNKEMDPSDQEHRIEPASGGRKLIAAIATVAFSIVVMVAGLLFCGFSLCAFGAMQGGMFGRNGGLLFAVAALVSLGISIGGVFLIVRINRKK